MSLCCSETQAKESRTKATDLLLHITAYNASENENSEC